MAVVLQIGDRGQRFCARFGGASEYEPDKTYRGRRAPVPAECPR